MKRIKYISYYDRADSLVKRNYVLAASNKMDYIISAINKSGIAVDVISFSGCVGDKFCFDRGGIQTFGINSLRHFSSLGPSDKGFVRLLSRYWLTIHFFVWFLKNIEVGEKILVYHSLGYSKLLLFLKKIKKCKYIGEIEEIYQDVTPLKMSICRDEYKFIYSCDSYIFPTCFLNTKLNTSGKPYVLIHGIYEVEKLRGVKWEDSDIHVIYAGTFDSNKGGAVAAVKATAFLSGRYHMHICGFGTNEDTEQILGVIEQISKSSKAKITYEGLLRGEDFICLLQRCHIGLSTQDPSAAFNATSFPSKILTYLANGLKVVSVRIPVVEQSDVSECVSYYDNQTPEDIAQAIKAIEYDNLIDSKRMLNILDKKFSQEILKLLL